MSVNCFPNRHLQQLLTNLSNPLWIKPSGIPRVNAPLCFTKFVSTYDTGEHSKPSLFHHPVFGRVDAYPRSFISDVPDAITGGSDVTGKESSYENRERDWHTGGDHPKPRKPTNWEVIMTSVQ